MPQQNGVRMSHNPQLEIKNNNKKNQLKCCHIINTIITKESDIPKQSQLQ